MRLGRGDGAPAFGLGGQEITRRASGAGVGGASSCVFPQPPSASMTPVASRAGEAQRGKRANSLKCLDYKLN